MNLPKFKNKRTLILAAIVLVFNCERESFAQCPCPLAPEVWSPPARLKMLEVGSGGAGDPWVTTTGDTMYLITGLGIYRSVGHDTVWSVPVELNSNVNRSLYVDAPTVSPDGKKLFFRDYNGVWNIWESDWSGGLNDWGPAIMLDTNVNNGQQDTWTAFTPDDSTLYFDRIVGSGDDLRLSRWDDSLNDWRPSVSLEPVYAGEPAKFNSWNSMSGISMTGDEKRAYFASYDQSGAHAEYDMFVSYYDSVKGWGPPLELNINSHPADSIPWYNPSNLGKDEYPSVTADGKWLYFDSNRAPDSSFSIYVSHLVIDQYGDSVVYTGIKQRGSERTPGTVTLFPGYPNPFNPSTTLTYQLSAVSQVTLKVYDVLGREVATLVKRSEYPGLHTVKWGATDDAGHSVSSGVYLIKLIVNGSSQVEKVVLLH